MEATIEVMTMYEELIKNLRIHSGFCSGYPHYCGSCTESESVCDVSLAGQSADAIEELSKQRWIPVTERLPEKPKNYPHCALRECYFLVALESTAVVSCGYDYENKRWHSDFRVTHWMPLPEPPKEET